MAKEETYVIHFKQTTQRRARHYVVKKMEEDTPPEMAPEYDVILGPGEAKSCNCPGWTYHATARARGEQHKHIRMARMYEGKYPPTTDKHPIAGMFILMQKNGTLEETKNPFSMEGLDDEEP